MVRIGIIAEESSIAELRETIGTRLPVTKVEGANDLMFLTGAEGYFDVLIVRKDSDEIPAERLMSWCDVVISYKTKVRFRNYTIRRIDAWDSIAFRKGERVVGEDGKVEDFSFGVQRSRRVVVSLLHQIFSKNRYPFFGSHLETILNMFYSRTLLTKNSKSIVQFEQKINEYDETMSPAEDTPEGIKLRTLKSSNKRAIAISQAGAANISEDLWAKKIYDAEAVHRNTLRQLQLESENAIARGDHTPWATFYADGKPLETLFRVEARFRPKYVSGLIDKGCFIRVKDHMVEENITIEPGREYEENNASSIVEVDLPYGEIARVLRKIALPQSHEETVEYNFVGSVHTYEKPNIPGPAETLREIDDFPVIPNIQLLFADDVPADRYDYDILIVASVGTGKSTLAPFIDGVEIDVFTDKDRAEERMKLGIVEQRQSMYQDYLDKRKEYHETLYALRDDDGDDEFITQRLIETRDRKKAQFDAIRDVLFVAGIKSVQWPRKERIILAHGVHVMGVIGRPRCGIIWLYRNLQSILSSLPPVLDMSGAQIPPQQTERGMVAEKNLRDATKTFGDYCDYPHIKLEMLDREPPEKTASEILHQVHLMMGANYHRATCNMIVEYAAKAQRVRGDSVIRFVDGELLQDIYTELTVSNVDEDLVLEFDFDDIFSVVLTTKSNVEKLKTKAPVIVVTNDLAIRARCCEGELTSRALWDSEVVEHIIEHLPAYYKSVREYGLDRETSVKFMGTFTDPKAIEELTAQQKTMLDDFLDFHASRNGKAYNHTIECDLMYEIPPFVQEIEELGHAAYIAEDLGTKKLEALVRGTKPDHMMVYIGIAPGTSVVNFIVRKKIPMPIFSYDPRPLHPELAAYMDEPYNIHVSGLFEGDWNDVFAWYLNIHEAFDLSGITVHIDTRSPMTNEWDRAKTIGEDDALVSRWIRSLRFQAEQFFANTTPPRIHLTRKVHVEGTFLPIFDNTMVFPLPFGNKTLREVRSCNADVLNNDFNYRIINGRAMNALVSTKDNKFHNVLQGDTSSTWWYEHKDTAHVLDNANELNYLENNRWTEVLFRQKLSRSYGLKSFLIQKDVSSYDDLTVIPKAWLYNINRDYRNIQLIPGITMAFHAYKAKKLVPTPIDREFFSKRMFFLNLNDPTVRLRRVMSGTDYYRMLERLLFSIDGVSSMTQNIMAAKSTFAVDSPLASAMWSAIKKRLFEELKNLSGHPFEMSGHALSVIVQDATDYNLWIRHMAFLGIVADDNMDDWMRYYILPHWLLPEGAMRVVEDDDPLGHEAPTMQGQPLMPTVISKTAAWLYIKNKVRSVNAGSLPLEQHTKRIRKPHTVDEVYAAGIVISVINDFLDEEYFKSKHMRRIPEVLPFMRNNFHLESLLQLPVFPEVQRIAQEVCSALLFSFHKGGEPVMR